MANLSVRDQAFLEDLFGMTGGYVLNFSNAKFSQFFAIELGVDIYDDRYLYGSGSKANLLRGFWRAEDDNTVGRSIRALLDYIDTEIALEHYSEDSFKPKVRIQCDKIAERLIHGGTESPRGRVEIQTFLRTEFDDLSEAIANVERDIQDVMHQRLAEAEAIFTLAPLATILLIGSTLEGILLDTAIHHSKLFASARAAPKTDGKAKPITRWRLSDLIDVAFELGFVAKDVKQFSHVLRDYRNFIHPRAQAKAGFHPTVDTAGICLQVLKAAVSEVSAKSQSLG